MRGNHIAAIGLVRIVRATPDELNAIAKGDDEYRVQLTRSGNEHITITGSCECPTFVEHFAACKHMWAALRLAEKRNLLTGSTGVTATAARLVLLDEDDLFLDPADSDDVDGARMWLPTLPKRIAAKPARAADPVSSLVEALRVPMSAEPPASGFRYDGAQLLYVFDVPATLALNGGLAVEVMWRRKKKEGPWTVPRELELVASELHLFSDADREVLARLVGASPAPGHDRRAGAAADSTGTSWFALPPATLVSLAEQIALTGRSYVRAAHGETPSPLKWEAQPWTFRPVIDVRESMVHVDGVFERGTESQSIIAPVLVLGRGLIFTRLTVSPLERQCDFSLIAALRRSGPVDVPPAKQMGLAEGLARAGVPAESLPESLRVTTVAPTPQPRMNLRKSPGSNLRLRAAVSFEYDGFLQPSGGPRIVFDAERRRMITRDVAAEAAAMARLAPIGFTAHADFTSRSTVWEVATTQLLAVVRALTSEGWHVSAEGRVYQSPRRVSMAVTSGINWFDLTAKVEFGEETLPLGDVLAALRRREVMVRLGDGTVGLLPEDWLKRYGPLAATGEETEDGLRFKPSQAALLDVLLSAQENEEGNESIAIDEAFAKAREQLSTFTKIEAVDPPPTFKGTLRSYQREGLGWLQFLRHFGFGGCLADDMGLGKTVMMLALFEWRRTDPTVAPEDRRPSLVVVPRSLVHNWHAEAAAFTPELRVLDYSGSGRGDDAQSFADCDVVLATYGTLRRDIAHLKDVDFEYVVLDEAQAIKNPGTVAAKSVRLLRGRHRLALSGTPIENHLGELWSLFNFLNPGLLGSSPLFRASTRALGADPEMLSTIARGLRPFILRRTKEQVARDLPPRTEQTIMCELEPRQRTFYNSIRAHYRQSVLAHVDKSGMAKSNMRILEALLRLRQAACHPGLIDKSRVDDPCAKLDMLVPRLVEIAESGHKALVFSQFTSLLALLRRRLDAAGLTYEYLDGHTKDRRGRVERFQKDPDCPVFLISLKAGGVGLNLTSAGYVFLLDPWWNPAVEAQAIDRAHRIGQTREVFAYRLIANDTVEAKVLELQQSKRALADAILRADGGGIRGITREDVEMLLT